jgi:hypothetical protein
MDRGQTLQSHGPDTRLAPTCSGQVRGADKTLQGIIPRSTALNSLFTFPSQHLKSLKYAEDMAQHSGR